MTQAQSNPEYHQALQTALGALDYAKVMVKDTAKVINAWSQVVSGMNYKFLLSGTQYCTDDAIQVYATVYCDTSSNCSMSCTEIQT